MAETSTEKKIFKLEELQCFPPVQDGHINLMQFLNAASDLLSIVDCLGKVFNPVKYDMQGNIDKIKSSVDSNINNSCLFELILKEKSEGRTTVGDATLWLNRALLFFEITFLEILNNINKKIENINMKAIFTTAYEGSVKKYHNWIIQQLFTVICKMSPTFPQLLTSLGLENVESFQSKMTEFTATLHTVRETIDNFFIENNLISTT